MKKSDFWHIDFILLILVNIFFINVYCFFICTLLLLPLTMFIWSVLNFFLPLIDFQKIQGILSLFCFFGYKFFLIPIYSYFEKYSKNTVVQKFIYNLKSSLIWKIAILYLVSLYPIIELEDFGKTTVAKQLILYSGFMSYVILFIWWKIQKINNTNK